MVAHTCNSSSHEAKAGGLPHELKVSKHLEIILFSHHQDDHTQQRQRSKVLVTM